jgi:hypothetical protein
MSDTGVDNLVEVICLTLLDNIDNEVIITTHPPTHYSQELTIEDVKGNKFSVMITKI